MTEAAEHPDRIRSFVHQRNRLTDGQRDAWDRWWPRFGRDVVQVCPGPGEPFWDPHPWFGRSAPVYLEIGSGTGETTVELAAAQPEHDHLAVEVYEPGIARLLMRVAERDLTNQRVLRGDAVELLSTALGPGSLAGIRIFFPDPWPKRRHHKRRLVQPPFVRLATSRIRDGGTLHLATDWPHYAEQMRAVCAAEPTLRPLGALGSDGWPLRPDWRPLTKFERRAVTDRRPVRDLVYSVVHGTGSPVPPAVTGDTRQPPGPHATRTPSNDPEGPL